MISYNPKNWFSLIFDIHKSDTLRKLFKTIIFFSIYSTVVLYLELHYTNFKSTIAVHSLLGFVIGLLLVFRTNTAYDRWWEGRQKWGDLVNTSRNLAMKMDSILPENLLKEREFYSIMISNYVFSCKDHLRGEFNEKNLTETDSFKIKHIENIEHKPNHICNMIFNKTHELNKKNLITGNLLITIDNQIKIFSDVLGSCERIKNTPIPYSYNIFLKKFIFVYTLSLPFGLVTDLGYWSIPISTFILYILCSLEILAEEIEDPFGKDANDLPLDSICNTIQKNVNDILISKYRN